MTEPMAANFQFPAGNTLIDKGRIQLVDIIGTGGYGVVYRATDVDPRTNGSYAVKCLIRSPLHRQSQLREISLHKMASSHPGIVTLHNVVEEGIYTYLVMDYAPDQDLFVQILLKSRYLGNTELIKNAFIQLLDATEHCHSLGIFHRDLKPENILCYDNGLRIALTDFGLATTQSSSVEFRTGSVFHMSPECQMEECNMEGVYSPQSNDIWSLGIVLLNIVTGRNPWKCANNNDPTFQAYLCNPQIFLPSILPISSELNEVLIPMLNIDWRARPSIAEVRSAVGKLESLYSQDVIFEGNLAKCSWESGVDLGTGTQKPEMDHVDVSVDEGYLIEGDAERIWNDLYDNGPSEAVHCIMTEPDTTSNPPKRLLILDDSDDSDEEVEYILHTSSSCSCSKENSTSTSTSTSTSSSRSSDSSIEGEPLTPDTASHFSSLMTSLHSFLKHCASSLPSDSEKDKRVEKDEIFEEVSSLEEA